ncbi:MAG: extracellular solute-binding protein [Treponema sp.]|jgi:raffinose/stachyose/melibiose transport system substrate-binding protein|nr:extracellular solute-binding protein [Treponema sp.]
MERIQKVAVSLLLVGMLCLIACKGKGDTSSASGGKPVEMPVVTFLIDKDTSFAGVQKVIDAIEAKLGIKTEVEIRAGGVEGDNIMKTRLATGDMADIFWYNTGSKLGDLNPERNIYDITDEPFAANLSDAFKTAASVNGRLYAIPGASTQVGGIIYNKKVYQELGLSVPHTWKDFLANCDKIQVAGKTALIAGFKDTWTSQLLILGDEYNVKTLMPNFPAEYTANRAKYANTSAARRGFEKIAETRRYMNKDYLAATYDVALGMLVTGDGVHWPMLTQALSNIYTLYPDKIDDIGVFGIPGDDPNNHGLTAWVSDGLYIYKNTPHQDLAKKWIEFYVSQEGISIYGSEVKPNGPYAIKGIDLPEDSYAAVKEMQPYFDTEKVDVALEFESPVKGPNLEQICIEVASGNTSAAVAATAYDADVQKQAIQLNLPGW